MAKSSAISIPYDIRPSKQLERRIILDMLMMAGACGLPVGKSTYVGMGGIKFFDFIMFYRYLALKKYISVEHDQSLLARCNFNKPFANIKMYDGAFSDFILEFHERGPHVFWIDYDYGLTQDLKDDILSLGSKLPPDSFLLLTVDGEPNKAMAKSSSEKRMDALQAQLGYFMGQKALKDFEDDYFRFMVADVLIRIIRFAFNARPDGIFFPILKIIYKDSSWMVTIGGVFSQPGQASVFLQEWRGRMDFIPKYDNDKFFELPRFNITDAERRLLDTLTTKSRRSRSPGSVPVQLTKLGFDRKFVMNYQRLIRYIPRYFEAFT
jgi:hypothetical protein